MTNQIDIYQGSDGQTQIEVKFEQETVWLDAHAMASIYDVQRPAIVKHINNIYKSGELKSESTCSILEQVAAELFRSLRPRGRLAYKFWSKVFTIQKTYQQIIQAKTTR